MSELGILTKHAREHQEWLATATSDESKTVVLSSACRSRLGDIETNLLPRAAKLASKAKQVDAITQQPRFGPLTCNKISALFEELDALLAPYRDLAEAQEAVEQVQANAQVEAEAQAQALAQVLAAQVQKQQKQALAEASPPPPPPNDLVEMQALQEEADLLRQNRAAAKVQLQELVVALNGVRLRNAANSIGSFGTAFRQLPRASQQFISKLLSNICAHPNDEKLRRIRLNHPVIVENVSQFEAGIDAFLTMGWEAYLEVVAEDSGKPAPVAFAGPYSLFQLCSISRHNVVLSLSEPPVDDGDKGTATWVRWFDDLSAFHASIS